MQYADNFDQVRRDHSVVEDVHRPPHLRLRVVHARVPGIETADAWSKFGATACRWTFWIGRHLAYRRRKQRGVTAPALNAPPLGAGGEDAYEIRLRLSRETKARHLVSARPSLAPP